MSSAKKKTPLSTISPDVILRISLRKKKVKMTATITYHDVRGDPDAVNRETCVEFKRSS